MNAEIYAVALPFILSLVCYCFIVCATKITTSYISESSFSLRHLSRQATARIYLAFAILSLLASIFILYFYPNLFSRRTSPLWSTFSLISLFTGLITIIYYCLLTRVNSLDSIRYLGHNYRQKGISPKFLARLLRPVNSIKYVILLFSLIFILPYTVRGAIIFFFGQRTSPSYQLESLFVLLTFSVLGAPIFEEIFYRWFPYKFFSFGVRGLIVGSILWLVLHPIDRFQTGMNWVQVWPSIPFWLLDTFFYIKLWQGKYYWTAFIFHSLTNLIVISTSTFLGIPS